MLVNSQAFLNSASLKFTKISSNNSGFDGRSSTVQEDIVAMVAAKHKKPSAGTTSSDAIKKAKLEREGGKKFPPFAKHFKSSSAADATVYKVGDSKEWNSLTWYYCDCPLHRDKFKWHTHTAETCRTRKKWLEDGGKQNSPIAQVAGTSDGSTATPLTAPTITANSNSTQFTDVTSLLAAALSMAGNNSAAKEAIADALNAIHDE
jgi:hypothetical protein